MGVVGTKEEKLKIAVYIRVSTKRFSQKESLENQRSYFEDYVEKSGGSLSAVYSDEGITGSSMAKREGLRKLMADAEKQRFDVVYVKSISRWARDTIDSLTLVRKLKSLKINLKSITESYDAFNDNGEFLLTLYSAIAQQESENTSARIKFSTAETARNGIHHGPPPYGYKKINKRLISHPVYALTVQKIFHLYLYKGWGTQKIANYLTSENIPTPRTILGAKNAGKTWHDSTIRGILKNKHYVGDLVQGKQKTDDNDKVFLQKHGYKKRINMLPQDHIVVVDTHEALISRKEFEEVQFKLQKKGEKNYSGRGVKSLFARLAFCSDCQAGMVYKKDRQGYVCGTYQRQRATSCSSHIIKGANLKSAVLSDLKELAGSNTNMKSLLDILLKRAGFKANHLKEESKRIIQEISNVDNEITQLTRSLAKGHITAEIFKMTSEVILAEQRTLKDRLAEISRLIITEEDNEQYLEAFRLELKKFVNLNIQDKEVLRDILHKLINKIEVFPDGSISIHYNFRNPILEEKGLS